tara:strand:- start:3323 stop:3628 length:306 start_codon:yes stop_codon:yes gene_type:complete
MKKFTVIFLILTLVLFTAFIKNSTKRIDDMIFITKENIRSFNSDFENIRLEYDYLSSAENLLKFQGLYFDDELKKKNIHRIKIISKGSNKIEIKELKFINE